MVNRLPLPVYLQEQAARVNAWLGKNLPGANTHPKRLHEAMRYSVQAGGKRLRPILVLAAAELCRGHTEDALPAAGAVECIHTYSLIHDDLPCMDNDDLRRGRPTCHKAFGEAVALLAGDALLTKAFEFVAAVPAGRRYATADFVRLLAVAAGSTKLIGGQTADMEAETIKVVTPARLRRIHEGKTAAMIAVSLRLGAMSAQAAPARVEALGSFGEDLGLAFQIIDDILDVTQSCEVLGKSPGKDSAAGKATYPAVFGLDQARRAAERATRRALGRLDSFGSPARRLKEIAAHLLERQF